MKALDGNTRLEDFAYRRFEPFDPVRKRTEVEVGGYDGSVFRVVKGAPQVILDLARPDSRVLGIRRKPWSMLWPAEAIARSGSRARM